jgi:GH24 family phage-related lysozyme (muramidase)
MAQPRKALADLLRPRLSPPGFNDPAFLAEFNRLLDAGGMARDDEAAAAPVPPQAAPAAASVASGPLTPRILLELVSHEAIVQEAYKDGGGVWTWGVGVTDASGHSVDRYRDNPQFIEHCLEVFVWLVRQRYLPDVLKAFGGHALTEAQIAAALSFHYNTGAIGSTEWVKDWLAGSIATARTFLESHYQNGGVLTERRAKEAALFFDGKWSNDGTALVVPVAKPSYTPSWRNAKRVNITAEVAAALAAAGGGA